ncbi:MAG: DUF5668 domain-containing protein [Acidobacteriota bacterium]
MSDDNKIYGGLGEPSPDREIDDSKTGRLILGLTLIGIGVAYILDRLDYVDASEIWTFWPLVLVAAGLGKLATPGGAGRLAGAILTAVGSLLLLENLDVIDFDLWDWWPVIFIFVGLRFIFGARRQVYTNSFDTVNSFAALGGTSRKNTSLNFRGGDLVAFMGGCEIDLRGASITTAPAVLDAFAFWGGIEVKVPEHWDVKVRGVPVLGGFENSTRFEARDGDFGPRQELVVKGFAIMGGVEISN